MPERVYKTPNCRTSSRPSLTETLLFMRAVAEGFIFRETTAAKLGILDSVGDIAISITSPRCA